MEPSQKMWSSFHVDQSHLITLQRHPNSSLASTNRSTSDHREYQRLRLEHLGCRIDFPLVSPLTLYQGHGYLPDDVDLCQAE